LEIRNLGKRIKLKSLIVSEAGRVAVVLGETQKTAIFHHSLRKKILVVNRILDNLPLSL